ncbi:hypothetical protein FRB93_010009 [Tulasnella sp. JGI-2019a]|nr:hypothetical protein FRB93_010009 [Tulasnella sp. JGI-2019a]
MASGRLKMRSDWSSDYQVEGTLQQYRDGFVSAFFSAIRFRQQARFVAEHYLYGPSLYL